MRPSSSPSSSPNSSLKKSVQKFTCRQSREYFHVLFLAPARRVGSGHQTEAVEGRRWASRSRPRCCGWGSVGSGRRRVVKYCFIDNQELQKYVEEIVQTIWQEVRGFLAVRERIVAIVWRNCGYSAEHAVFSCSHAWYIVLLYIFFKTKQPNRLFMWPISNPHIIAERQMNNTWYKTRKHKRLL